MGAFVLGKSDSYRHHYVYLNVLMGYLLQKSMSPHCVETPASSCYAPRGWQVCRSLGCTRSRPHGTAPRRPSTQQPLAGSILRPQAPEQLQMSYPRIRTQNGILRKHFPENQTNAKKPTLSFDSISKDKSSSKACSWSLDTNPQELAGFSAGVLVSCGNTKYASYTVTGEVNFDVTRRNTQTACLGNLITS